MKLPGKRRKRFMDVVKENMRVVGVIEEERWR